MSLYSDFNDIDAEITTHDNKSLTKLEKKRIKKRIQKKLSPAKRRVGFIAASVAAIALSAIVVTSPTIANMPLVAGLLEDWKPGENQDFTEYKNPIGITATTENGELTLNEVIVDYDKILISSTFVKPDDFSYSHRYQMLPDIYMNGEKLEVTNTAAQSIEQNSSMYTVYIEVGLAAPLDSAELDLEIVYARMLTPDESDPIDGVRLSEPWKFDVNANQLAVQENTVVSTPSITVPALDGGSFVVDKVIRTPISTTIYFSESTVGSELNIQLVDAEGNAYSWDNAYIEDDKTGMFSFSGVSFVDKELFIQAREYYPDNKLGELVAIPE
ncbi:DUF4179 domain-containing protein [Chryseomicrobium sp. FSL W7-1435]|uniref:DUF4179 domain-containing protein n=1 Tax=Chryseomicrobium sp. FSL W7-1435 TaxID=2921704 RepID=UPI00315A9BEB